MKEYGGYLPLELMSRRSDLSSLWRNGSTNDIAYLNSGRTAIYYALKIMCPHKIYVPYYICHTVIEVIEKLDIPYEYYQITHDLECPIRNVKENECVVVVNYFGICDKYISLYAKQYVNLLIDNTQALFCEPIIKDSVYNVYSYRKFVGVSDGGALVGSNIHLPFLIDKDESYSRINFLAKSIELGTNAAYADYKSSITAFNDRYLEMSAFTCRLLLSIDYQYVKDRRRENYRFIHSLLHTHNRLDCAELGEDTIACWYPLLLDKDISNNLIEKKIYVPRLWKELYCESFKNSFEYELSGNLLLLPIDQRYNRKDIEYIADTVKSYI